MIDEGGREVECRVQWSSCPLISSLIFVTVRRAVLMSPGQLFGGSKTGMNEPVYSWRCWLVGTWAQQTSNFAIIRMLGTSCGNSVHFISQYLENTHMALQVALVVTNPSANAGDIRDLGWIPGSGRSPGGGHGNPFQYFCRKNPVNRGTWWAAVPQCCKELDTTEWLSTHTLGSEVITVIGGIGTNVKC